MTHYAQMARRLHLYVASPDGTFWATEQNREEVLGAGTDKRGRQGEEAQQHVTKPPIRTEVSEICPPPTEARKLGDFRTSRADLGVSRTLAPSSAHLFWLLQNNTLVLYRYSFSVLFWVSPDSPRESRKEFLGIFGGSQEGVRFRVSGVSKGTRLAAD